MISLSRARARKEGAMREEMLVAFLGKTSCASYRSKSTLRCHRAFHSSGRGGGERRRGRGENITRDNYIVVKRTTEELAEVSCREEIFPSGEKSGGELTVMITP